MPSGFSPLAVMEEFLWKRKYGALYASLLLAAVIGLVAALVSRHTPPPVSEGDPPTKRRPRVLVFLWTFLIVFVLAYILIYMLQPSSADSARQTGGGDSLDSLESVMRHVDQGPPGF